MELVTLTCRNQNQSAGCLGSWKRESQRGRLPFLCPPCNEHEKTKDAAPKIQNLICQNTECSEPNWQRESQKGMAPAFCPMCRAQKNAEEIVSVPTEPRFQELVCTADGCLQPNWTREFKMGALPIICPACRAKKEADKPTHMEATCQNPECENPKWMREVKRGKAPALCPVCRSAVQEVNEEEEEESVEVVKDYPVFSSLSADAVERALTALRLAYRRTEFYVQTGEEAVIMIRRNKYGVKYSAHILDNVRNVASVAGVVEDNI